MSANEVHRRGHSEPVSAVEDELDEAALDKEMHEAWVDANDVVSKKEQSGKKSANEERTGAELRVTDINRDLANALEDARSRKVARVPKEISTEKKVGKKVPELRVNDLTVDLADTLEEVHGDSERKTAQEKKEARAKTGIEAAIEKNEPAMRQAEESLRAKAEANRAREAAALADKARLEIHKDLANFDIDAYSKGLDRKIKALEKKAGQVEDTPEMQELQFLRLKQQALEQALDADPNRPGSLAKRLVVEKERANLQKLMKAKQKTIDDLTKERSTMKYGLKFWQWGKISDLDRRIADENKLMAELRHDYKLAVIAPANVTVERLNGKRSSEQLEEIQDASIEPLDEILEENIEPLDELSDADISPLDTETDEDSQLQEKIPA